MIKKVVLFCFGLLLISFMKLDQNLFAELVEEKLSDYTLNHSPEKIYIHTDKSHYALDESIWYTGYLVDGITHTKTSKSWVLYVEIIDDNDSILDKKKCFTNDICFTGDFKIDKDWQPGNYMIRAYTNYMRNESQENFFRKKLNIISTEGNEINNNKKLSRNNTSDGSFNVLKPDLGLYPEGGYLVENIRSKIALKVRDEIYQDTSLIGRVVDEENNLQLEFQTGELGLSIINFKPEANKSYNAIIDIGDVQYSYPLPKALPKGYVLSSNYSDNFIILSVQSTVPKGVDQCYLVVHQRGKMIYNKMLEETKDMFTIKLPVNNLKDGVVHVTLFDPSGNPVCERLVYVHNPVNSVKVGVSKSNSVLSTREKLALSIHTKDFLGNDIPSQLSVSVRDASIIPNGTFLNNIKSYLLLNSDLENRIEEAGYFFKDEFTPKKRYLLDLVMLTNGWRRFTWPELLYKKRKHKFEIEKGIYISGNTHLLKKPYGPVPSVTRLSFFGDNIHQEPVQKTDENGRFKYGPFVFFDSIQTLVESRLTNFKSEDDKDRNILILMDNRVDTPEIINNISKIEEDVSNQQLENFRRMSAYMQQVKNEYDARIQRLNEITIIAKKEDALSERNKEMDARANYGRPSHRIDVENNPFANSAVTVFDLLIGVPGVRANGNSISIRGSNGTPNIIYDGFPIDIDFLSTIDPSQISFIDVLSDANAGFYANSANGIIAIYSRIGTSGTGGSVKRKPGIIDFLTEGFYRAREFYAPDHISGMDEQMKADIRTTLHWEPYVRISKNGSESFSFFTSDSKGEYVIEIEGITDSGIPIYYTSTFAVD